ncbi:MAG: biotin transporter BioY [Paracoccaceae bacterium]
MTNSLVRQLTPAAAQGLGARVGMVLAGTVLLAMSAKVQVPFWPVPMTLQTLVVLLIGAGFGARMAGATLLAYLAQGAVGLPVFATGAGLAYMAGPTGGYLAGFLLGAVFVGWAAGRGLTRGLLSAVAVFLIADVLIFVPGVLWLAGYAGADAALALGLVPFLPGEVLKIVIAAGITHAAWRRVPGPA